LQARVQMSPMIEEQLKELMRSYQTAQEFYNELQKKRANAAMATERESQQQSGNFRVLDPPTLPNEPSFPKVPMFLGGGLGAGLVLALAVLYLLATMDHAMYTERDVELGLKMPVLTMVPSLEQALYAKSSKHHKDAGKFDSAMALKASCSARISLGTRRSDIGMRAFVSPSCMRRATPISSRMG